MTDALALSLERILRPCKYSVRQDGLDSLQYRVQVYDEPVNQEILGHSSYSITADIYTDVLPSMQREAMDKWDDVFKLDDRGDEQVD